MFKVEHTQIGLDGIIRDIKTYILSDEEVKVHIDDDKRLISNMTESVSVTHKYCGGHLVSYAISYQDNNLVKSFVYSRVN